MKSFDIGMFFTVHVNKKYVKALNYIHEKFACSVFQYFHTKFLSRDIVLQKGQVGTTVSY